MGREWRSTWSAGPRLTRSGKTRGRGYVAATNIPHRAGGAPGARTGHPCHRPFVIETSTGYTSRARLNLVAGVGRSRANFRRHVAFSRYFPEIFRVHIYNVSENICAFTHPDGCGLPIRG